MTTPNKSFQPFIYYYSNKYGMLAKISRSSRFNYYAEQFNTGNKMIPQFKHDGTVQFYCKSGCSKGAMNIREIDLMEYYEIPYGEYLIRLFPYMVRKKYNHIMTYILDKYYELIFPEEK